MYDINNIPNGILDDNESRNKEIIDILQLKEDSIFTDSLIEIITAYKENKIDTITAYQYINSVLGRYYYCVTMPKEDEELRQKRKNKSGIEICNPDDPTERAIKENLEINQQFPNFRKMLETIGIENLDMYKSDKTLITKYEELQGGKQKEKTKKIINQYMLYEKAQQGKQAIEILDIYDEPILVIFEGKGKSNNGFYINRLSAALIQGILQNDKDTFDTTVNKLIQTIPITNDMYDKAKHLIDTNNSEELLTLFTRFFDDSEEIKEYMIKNLINSCYNELQNIIFRLLNNLSNNYCVISYDESFQIITTDGEVHIANKTERSIIKKAYIKVMKDMGLKNLNSLYYRKAKQIHQFYKRVNEYINQKYNYNWHRIRKSITITIEDRERLIEIYNSYCNNNGVSEVKEKFQKRIQTIINKDFENNRNKLTQNIDKFYQNTDIQEMKEIGIFSDNDLQNKAKNGIFQYPEQYREIQNTLLQLLINE